LSFILFLESLTLSNRALSLTKLGGSLSRFRPAHDGWQTLEGEPRIQKKKCTLFKLRSEISY